MILGGILGGISGELAGSELGHSLGFGDAASSALGAAGSAIGSALGTIFPFFKTGGGVKGSRKNAHLCILHGKEFVLPSNVRPTKHQEAVVRSNKLKQSRGSSVYAH